MNIFQSILYPPPPSFFLNAITAVSLIACANFGISEVRGTHLAYSKFWNWKEAGTGKSTAGTAAKVSGRTGMLILYTPALVAAAVLLAFEGNQNVGSGTFLYIRGKYISYLTNYNVLNDGYHTLVIFK
ncbi:hypothetical protein LUZ61_013328 [Rhynchospora tenuis]|uniref:Uncharacterized protein n=1 Tax=Rhynchospora tenuis TaxID=198213 RepID=A0AAD5W9C5_9POAL|nr:hypothetical protein LUZ61_013328 [Rhynchospora tenuis]